MKRPRAYNNIATPYLARVEKNRAEEEARIMAAVDRAKAEGTLGDASPHHCAPASPVA